MNPVVILTALFGGVILTALLGFPALLLWYTQRTLFWSLIDVLRFAVRGAPFEPGLFLLVLRRPRALVRALRVGLALGVFRRFWLCHGFRFEDFERCGACALVLGQVTLLVLLAGATKTAVVSPCGLQTHFVVAVSHWASRWFGLDCAPPYERNLTDSKWMEST